MPTQDYWGDFQVTDDQLTPAQILKEQASAFNERVGRHIRASVATSGLRTQKFRSTLAVMVPSLDRYHLDIVTVIYPLIEYYPLILSDDLADEQEELVDLTCKSEEEFRKELHRILSSTRTTDTLNSLLSLAA